MAHGDTDAHARHRRWASPATPPSGQPGPRGAALEAGGQCADLPPLDLHQKAGRAGITGIRTPPKVPPLAPPPPPPPQLVTSGALWDPQLFTTALKDEPQPRLEVTRPLRGE